MKKIIILMLLINSNSFSQERYYTKLKVVNFDYDVQIYFPKKDKYLFNYIECIDAKTNKLLFKRAINTTNGFTPTNCIIHKDKIFISVVSAYQKKYKKNH
jgi:hypothetical protein